MCGGLINVDKSTIEKSFLSHVRLHLKGLKGGLIPESLDIHCLGKKIKLKLLAFNDRRFRFFGVCTKKWKEIIHLDNEATTTCLEEDRETFFQTQSEGVPSEIAHNLETKETELLTPQSVSSPIQLESLVGGGASL